MARPRPIAVASVLVVVAIILYLATPPALVHSPRVPELPGDLDAYLAGNERRVSGRFALLPDTEKRISWRERGVATDYAVVYLHGFSATRQETAPLAAKIAAGLEANLFETRLSGHGHAESPMHEVRAEDWLDDAAEAIAIGARLGNNVVVVGTSTGGTLAVALSDHSLMQAVSDLVLISPNFEPRDAGAKWLTRPGGPLLARVIAGDTRSWTAHNERQARYWSTRYPIDAVVEVMRLVDFTVTRLPADVSQNLLVILSADDKVVSPDAAKRVFARTSAPRKRLVDIDGGDPSAHVLAGDILSPGTTDAVAEIVIEFVRGESARRDALSQ